MSPHKFKDYSMVKMDIDVRVANATVRNRDDELWKSWDEAKKTHFQDKYGDVAQLLFVKPNNALLKAMNVDFQGPLANLMGLPVDTVKARLKDKNGPCISWSDIMDAMRKANGDRHLSLFAFSVYGLIVFPKALGYVSKEKRRAFIRIRTVVICMDEKPF
ncbi:hypothetical protein Gogos_021282 [Gossypium gossypioides]|uniref:Uncharacterized protein n=1 Tax=Gossypium gossypioides TaxID=34282 RepID=A0A7J9D6L5_GOSGO|nr:hypothetical protein [Gossypium gossypioides]